MKKSDIKKSDDFYMWTSLLVVVIGTFMAILDTSIVNIALPKMMAVFQENVENSRWIITSYTLTLGAVVPLSGYVSDRYGTKNVYIFSLIAFTLGSLFCGLAWSNSSMIVFRIIQGIGGGLLMPVSMSIIFQIIPKEKRGVALGVWGIAAMAAPTIGPTLSGYIIEYLDWRLIFTVNIPVGVVGTIMTILLLKDIPKKHIEKFDFIGFLTSAIGLICCLYVLGEGSSIDWQDLKILLIFITGIFSLIIFVVNELLHPTPLLDLRVLKDFSFSLSIILSSFLNMAMFGMIFILPLFLQNLRGYTALQTGIIMLPSAIVTALFMPIGGRLYDKIGARPLAIPGVILIIITTFSLSKLSLETPLHFIILMMMLRGIGLGLTMMPSSTAGMINIPHNLIARASALSNTIRQVSSSLSIMILTTILQNSQNTRYAQYASDSNIFNNATTGFLNMMQGMFIQSGFTQSNAQASALYILSSFIQRQTFLDGVNVTLIVSTIFGLIALPMAFLIKRKHVEKKKQKEQEVILETEF